MGTDAQVDWPTEGLYCLGFWAMYLLLRKQGLKGSVLYTLSLRKLRTSREKGPPGSDWAGESCLSAATYIQQWPQPGRQVPGKAWE